MESGPFAWGGYESSDDGYAAAYLNNVSNKPIKIQAVEFECERCSWQRSSVSQTETNQIQKLIEDAAVKRDATEWIKLLEREEVIINANNNKYDNGEGGGESALDFAAKMLLGSTSGAAARKKEKEKEENIIN